ncbi:hypothetical protein FA95DRAFT_1526805, partial [Auriscalpium vulgare]
MAQDSRGPGGTASTRAIPASTVTLALTVEKCTGLPEVSHLKGFRALISVNGTKEKTKLASGTDPVWNEKYNFLDVPRKSSVKVVIQATRAGILRCNHYITDTTVILVTDLLDHPGQTYPLEIKYPSKRPGVPCHLHISALPSDQHSAAQDVMAKLFKAEEPEPTTIPSALKTAATIHDHAASAGDVWLPLLEKISSIADIIDKLSEAHPYLKAAWSILDAGRKIAVHQQELDDKIQLLIKTITEVYEVIKLDKLKGSEAQQNILNNMAKQTATCGRFILKYLQDKGFFNRMGKHLFSNTDKTIQQFQDGFEQMQRDFQRHGTVNIQFTAQDISADLKGLVEKYDISNIPYARGACYQKEKTCLNKTRVEFLQKIYNWVQQPDSNSAKVLLLTGLSGTGKSSLAHSTAEHFDKLGCLGSSFFFDHNDVKSRHPKSLFGTIAHDLADFTPAFRHALNECIGGKLSLQTSSSLQAQFDNFILKPCKNIEYISEPVVIVIDALDESAEFGNKDRKDLIKFIYDRFNELPSYLRIILTSRLEEDVKILTYNESGHIQCEYMNYIASDVIEEDIARYISDQLGDMFAPSDYLKLAKKAEGLFQWAHIACGLITDDGTESGKPDDEDMKQTFKDLIAMSPSQQLEMTILDELYKSLLTKRFSKIQDVDKLMQFLGMLLSAGEPISTSALQELHKYSKTETNINFGWIIGKLGSVLTGTTNHSEPIHFIHSSFRDFLLNKTKSGKLYIGDLSFHHQSLAQGTITALNQKLKFNMSHFPSSYLANKDAKNLDMSWFTNNACLSYAVSYWGYHLSFISFDTDQEYHIELFLQTKLLFWLEAVSLLQTVHGAKSTLRGAELFCKREDLKRDIQDVSRFLEMFGQPLATSMPQLYFLAASCVPEDTLIHQKYMRAQKLNHFPHLVKGRMSKWPTQRFIIHTKQRSNTIACSPDGRHIVSGSDTIHIWDTGTGEPICPPLEGHTGW